MNKSPSLRLLGVFGILPIIYMLSVGPSAWLCQHHLFPGRFMAKVYAPLGCIGGSGKDSWLMQRLDIWKS
jgi:hypothetical protein